MQIERTKESKSGDKPRLWVVSEPYYPEETSTGYYLTRIAEGLTGRFDVKVICGQPNYSARGTIAPKHEFHKDVEIFRASGTTLDKNIIPFRLVNMITHGISVLWNGLRRFKSGDRVLVVTTPPSIPFVVAVAALARGGSYTLLIHDNYPEILVASNKTTPGSMIVQVMGFLNRWLYKHASKIIVVGRDMRELLEKKTDGLDIPIATIPNWAELDAVRPLPRSENRLLGDLGIGDKLVVLYAGNMGYPNDIESIVEAADRLRDNTEIHFIFLGTGVKRRWLEETVAELKLPNMTILDPRPRSEQNDFLNACDVALVSLVRKMVGVSMPSRTYNILAVGKPILAIAEEDSEVAAVVKEDAIGWTVPPESPGTLVDVLLEIADSKHKFAAMGESARRAALEKYSMEVAIEKYESEL